MAMTNDPCISVVAKSGNRLIVNIPADFRDDFPQGTQVEIVKVKTTIERIGDIQKSLRGIT